MNCETFDDVEFPGHDRDDQGGAYAGWSFVGGGFFDNGRGRRILRLHDGR